MKYTIIILIVSIGLFFLQTDDELSPTAQEWVQKLELGRNSSSEAFIYLNGIMASEEDSVMKVGSARFAAYRKAEDQAKLSDNGIIYQDYPTEKEISKPSSDNEIYCRLSEVDCLDKILKNSSEWLSELKKYTVILQRYRRFIKFTEYRTLSKPSVYEETPKFEYLKYGNRLSILESLLLAEQGNPEAAIDLLNSEIESLRTQLVNADSIIYKLFFVNMIANNLDVMGYVSNRYNYYKALDIPFLNSDELSMKDPVIREFGMMYELYSNLDGNPEIFEKGGNAPSWLVRAIFKRNKTINESIPSFEKWIDISSLSQEEFAKDKVPENTEVEREVDLDNFVGSVLNSIGSPDFHKYMARLFDLNCKIVLVNYIIENKGKPLINPYYPLQKNAYKSSESEICMTGPYEDTRRLRCINLLTKGSLKQSGV
jgi:hypothetical protein